MLYLISTKRGIGVELWGTYSDLHTFYEIISRFWGDEEKYKIPGAENRDKVLSGFAHEIRKAYEGMRLKRKTNHFTLDEAEYFGTQISWVHFLFSLTALKYNMRYYELTKYEISVFLQIEFWLEKAMNSYDTIGARKLVGYIEDGIYGANEYIYQYMRSINFDYILLDGGKKAFRQLSALLQRGVYNTAEYQEYRFSLENDSKKLKCNITDLDIDDDDVNYEIKW